MYKLKNILGDKSICILFLTIIIIVFIAYSQALAYHNISVSKIGDIIKSAYQYDSYDETNFLGGWLDDSYIDDGLLSTKLMPEYSDLEMGDILLPLVVLYDTADKMIGNSSNQIDFFGWFKERDIQKAWARIISRQEQLTVFDKIYKELVKLSNAEQTQTNINQFLATMDLLKNGKPDSASFIMYVAGTVKNGTPIGDVINTVSFLMSPSIISAYIAVSSLANLAMMSIDDTFGYTDLRQAYLLYHIGHETVDNWSSKSSFPLVDMMLKASSGNHNNELLTSDHCFFWSVRPYHIGYPYQGGYDYWDQNHVIPLQPYDNEQFYTAWGKVLFHDSIDENVVQDNKTQAEIILKQLSSIFSFFVQKEKQLNISLEIALSRIKVKTYPISGSKGNCSSIGYTFGVEGPGIMENSLERWNSYFRTMRDYYANQISTMLRGIQCDMIYRGNSYFLGRGLGISFIDDPDSSLFHLIRANLKTLYEDKHFSIPYDNPDNAGLVIPIQDGWKQYFYLDGAKSAIYISRKGKGFIIDSEHLNYLDFYEDNKLQTQIGFPISHRGDASEEYVQYFEHGYLQKSDSGIETNVLDAYIINIPDSNTSFPGPLSITLTGELANPTPFQNVNYHWYVDAEKVKTGKTSELLIQPGSHSIHLRVAASHGMSIETTPVYVNVDQNPALAPSNLIIQSSIAKPNFGDHVILTPEAEDPSEQGLFYKWIDDHNKEYVTKIFEYDQPDRKVYISLYVSNVHGEVNKQISLGVNPDDVDDDGIEDAWERKYFDNDIEKCHPDGDPDHDGFLNAQEFTNETSPFEPNILIPDFEANIAHSDLPMIVRFKDISTVENIQITSWQWDFDNDGIIDANIQNPVFIYDQIGAYDVNLTVSSDIVEKSETKHGYIHVTDKGIATRSNIVCVEYFFDDDPGQGNGKTIQIEQNPNAFIQQSIDISKLSEGLHKLSVRAKNQMDQWGILQNKYIYIHHSDTYESMQTNIVNIEYNVNSQLNPSGTISVTPNTEIIQSHIIDISNLNNGLHRLYVNAIDSHSKSGIVQNKFFFINRHKKEDLPKKMTKIECFLDEDPGIGQGIIYSIDYNNFDNTIQVSINSDDIVSKVINQGLHRLYFRVKNEFDQWGVPQYKYLFFQNENNHESQQTNIVNIEYFFDSIISVENSNVISLTPASEIIENRNIDISSLKNGLHRLYVYAIDEHGSYGIIQNKYFLINDYNVQDSPEMISELELFIDQDPGFNNGIKIGSLFNNDYIDIEYILSLKNMIPGMHSIYVRAKNDQDIWGIPQSQSIDIKTIYGDIDYSRKVDLHDAIIILQLLAGIKEFDYAIQSGTIGMNNLIYILSRIAEGY